MVAMSAFTQRHTHVLAASLAAASCMSKQVPSHCVPFELVAQSEHVAWLQTGSRPFAGGRGRRRVPRVAVPIQLVYPQYGLGAPGMYSGMYNASGMGYAASYGGAVPAQPHMQTAAQAFGSAGPPAYGQGVPMGYYSYGYPNVVAPPAATGMLAGVQARPGPSAAERFGSQFRAVVHNLPWETSKSELFAAFSQWSPQDAHVMIDHRTGQSKCVPCSIPCIVCRHAQRWQCCTMQSSFCKNAVKHAE